MTGKTISHYAILEKLGEGGMGVVYKAEDVKLKRTVAIKFLPKRLSVHGEERDRFTLEAQAASALNHPNISTIYEIDEANGETFIVMEYIDGATLREWIRKRSGQSEGYRKTAVKESVDLAIQIAEGLDKAHEKGIVHRDVKSENVMVTAEDGRAKIMDFGLAKLGGVSKLTKTGSTIGTVAYMSPEQVEGQETDRRTDIFSFGVLLYELLSGVLPFRAAHETAMMYEILNVEPAPLAEINKSVDAELNRIVLKCLEKNREERYQSMKDVVVDLRRYNRDSAGKAVDRSGVRRETPAAAAPGNKRPSLPLILGIAAAVVLLAAGAWYFLGQRPSAPDSLAVLPFVNVGTDAEQEYLTEGITDNLINKLSKLSQLRVIPRSLVAKYKGKDVDPRDAGRELNVGAVLTGKIVQRGDGLMIQTELIDVKNVAQLWGEQYDKKLTDILSVQQDIAQKVTEKLQTRLSGEEQKHLAAPHSSSPEAYQLYLKGRYYWNKRTDDGSMKAMEYYQRAIDIDPAYAQAYAAMADVYFVYSPTALHPTVYMPRAKAAALKALELDPDLAEAHTALATYTAYYEFDLAGAEKEFRTAIALDPNYASAHHWLAEFLGWQGRFDEAFAEYDRAVALDPLSLAIASDLGAALYYSRQYDRSIEQLKKTEEMDPNFVRSHFYIVGPYLQKSLPDSAFSQLIQGMAVRGDSAGAIAKVRAAYASGGFAAIARLELEGHVSVSDVQSSFSAAHDNMTLGQYDKAIELMEQAYDGHMYYVMTINVDPAWDPLRAHPRFIALLNKIGFKNPTFPAH